jgi:predicted amidohydrolase
MENVKAAAVQFQHKTGDKAANFAVMRDFAGRAAADGVDILAFPECCITGYWELRDMSRGELEELAEVAFEGESSGKLMSMSRELGMTIGAGLVEKASDGALYNTYVVAMPDGRFARHRKIHCFINEHMSSGSEVTVFDAPCGCRVGVLICYDNNIVENARLTALAGAEVLLAPHQTGGCDSPSPYAMGLVDKKLWDNRANDPDALRAEFMGHKGREWITCWLPSRAHDNGMFLVFSNGVGLDGDEVRTGNSMIIDCYGRIISETDSIGDDMVTAELDGSLRPKCTGVRWMRSRRPELYGPIAVATGREEDTRKLRFEGKGI